MKTRVLTVSFALVLASVVSANAYCAGKHQQQTSSCVEGYVWDPDTSSCVAQPAS